MDVLDDEDERGALGQPREQTEEQLEEPALRGRPGRRSGSGRAAGQLGQDAQQLRVGRAEQLRALGIVEGAHVLANGGDEGPEGQAALGQVQTAADEAGRTLRGDRGQELPHEARLADAGVAGDRVHDGPAADDLGPARFEPGELGSAAHEARVGRVQHGLSTWAGVLERGAPSRSYANPVRWRRQAPLVEGRDRDRARHGCA